MGWHIPYERAAQLAIVPAPSAVAQRAAQSAVSAARAAAAIPLRRNPAFIAALSAYGLWLFLRNKYGGGGDGQEDGGWTGGGDEVVKDGWTRDVGPYCGGRGANYLSAGTVEDHCALPGAQDPLGAGLYSQAIYDLYKANVDWTGNNPVYEHTTWEGLPPIWAGYLWSRTEAVWTRNPGEASDDAPPHPLAAWLGMLHTVTQPVYDAAIQTKPGDRIKPTAIPWAVVPGRVTNPGLVESEATTWWPPKVIPEDNTDPIYWVPIGGVRPVKPIEVPGNPAVPIVPPITVPPVAVPGRDVILSVGNVTGVRAVAKSHVYARPATGNIEGKRKAISGAAAGRYNALNRAIGSATEMLEAIDCIFKSIPKAERVAYSSADKRQYGWKSKKDLAYDRKNEARGSDKKDLTPAEKRRAEMEGTLSPFGLGSGITMAGKIRVATRYAEALYHDKDFEAATKWLGAIGKCMIENQVQDIIYAGIGRGAAQGAARTGRPYGYQTGGAI